MKNYIYSFAILTVIFISGFFNPAYSQYTVSIKAGTTPNIFSSAQAASGGLGSMYYLWQDSIEGGTWGSAPGVNNKLDYQSPALYDTTYFRRMAYNDCGKVYSETLSINTLAPGGALRFDNFDYVVIPHDTSLNPQTSSFAIEFWIKTHYSSLDTNYNIVLAKYGNGNYEVAFSSSDKLSFNIADASNSQVIDTKTPIADNKWHHLALIRNIADSSLSIFVDGNLDTSSNLSVFGNIDPTEDLFLGAYNGNFPSKITLDEFRLWKRALSSAEINSQINCKLYGNEPRLTAYYNFNSGIANGNNALDTILEDHSKFGNNGTLKTFALIGDTSNWVLGKDSFDIFCAILNGPLISEIQLDSAINCNGYSNAVVTINALGGTPPYSYVWSTSETTASISGLAAGMYTVTVSTSSESIVDTIVITEPSPISVSSIHQDASCISAKDAYASIVASGGTPPYSYSWSDSSSSMSISNAMHGTYYYEVRDSNLCSVSDSVVISYNTAFKPSILNTHVALLCSGDTAKISVDTSGVAYCWFKYPAVEDWEVVGNYAFTTPDINQHSFAIDPLTAEPYIAFGDNSNSDKTTVMKFNGNYWEIVGSAGFTAGRAEYQSLAFHPTTSEAYVAYSDDNYSDKVSVMKFNGASWVQVGNVGFSSGRAEYISLAFHPRTFEPYVVFQDDANSDRTTVMSFDGKDWNVVGLSGFSPSSAEFQKLVFNPLTAEPYVVFSDNGSSNKSLLMKYDGINWVNVGSSFTPGSAVYLSLAFHPQSNEPYVAFQDRTNSNKTTVMKYNGSWTNVGNPGISSGGAEYQSLAFHPITNEAYVAFKDLTNSGRTTVMKFDGSMWVKVGSTAFSPGLSEGQNIAFHPQTFEPYVSFMDDVNGRSASVMKFSILCEGTDSTFNLVETGTYQMRINYANSCVAFSDSIVFIEDTLAPEVITQNVRIYLDSNGVATVTADEILYSVNDNCSIDTVYISQSNFNCNDLDSNLISLTAIDNNNNSSTEDAWVIVEDLIAPQIKAKNIEVFLDSTGSIFVDPIEVDNGSDDNCSMLIRSLSDSSFNCSNIGMNRVRYAVEDSSLNGSTITTMIEVSDTIAPVLLTKSASVYLDKAGNATAHLSMLDDGIFDNCQIDTITISPYTFNCSDLGINLVTITAWDIYNNSSSVVDTIYVKDSLPPQAIAKDTTIFLNALGEFVIDSSYINVASFDNCGIQSINLSKSYFDCSDLGQTKVFMTVTDASNNSSVDSAIVNLFDNSSPNAKTKRDTVYLNSNSYVLIDSSNIDNGSSDNCGIVSFTIVNDSLGCLDTGLTSLSYSIKDASNNVYWGTENVLVLDTLAPLAKIKDTSITLDANGQARIDSSYIDNFSTDNCKIARISLSQTNFSCADTGDNLINIRIYDENGNYTDTVATVKVSDLTPPIAIARDTLIYLDSNGEFTIDSSFVNLGSYDNCTISSIEVDSVYFDCLELGNNRVIITVTDLQGNFSKDTSNVRVEDTTGTEAKTKSGTVYLNADGLGIIDSSYIDNNSKDNCGISSFVLSKDSLYCNDIGPGTVSYVITDFSNNKTFGSESITVLDTFPPEANLKDTIVYLNSNGNVSIDSSYVLGQSIDNCGIYSVSLSQSSFTCLDTGINLIQVIIRDNSLNSTSSSVNVKVIDSISPEIYAQDTTIYLDQNGQFTIDSSFVDLNSTDNCSIKSIALSKFAFSCSDTGQNSITMTATDIFNNQSYTQATVTVKDTSSPVARVKNNVELFLDANGEVGIDSSYINNASYDNCSIHSITLSQDFFDCSDLDTTLISITIWDVNNNNTKVNTNVIVRDSILPQLSSCPSDMNVSTDPSSCTAKINWTAPTADDNCGIDSLVSNFSPNDHFPIGTTLVRYIAYDASMNTDTCTFTVTVVDDEKPLISNCPLDIVVSNDSGKCFASVDWMEPTAMDNCKLDSLISNFNPKDTFSIGVHEVLYIAYDSSMNVDSCSFTITVEDKEAAVLQCLNDTTICDPVFTYSSPGLTENCSGTVNITQIQGLSSGSTFPLGITRNTFVARDVAGNTDTCSFNVEVLGLPSQADAGNDETICSDSIYLNANIPTVGNAYWTVISGNATFSDSTAPNALATNLDMGLNTFTWNIANGICNIYTDTLQILRIGKVSNVFAGKDTLLCSEFEMDLNAEIVGSGQGQWAVLGGGGIVEDPTDANSKVSSLSFGENILEWTVSNSVCPIIADSIHIQVERKPMIDLGEDKTVYSGDTITITAKVDIAVASYSWSPSFNLSSDSIWNPVAKPNETTTYTVEVISMENCVERADITIYVNELLEIATGLTPNNDGKNDVWIIKNIHKFPEAELNVYSRIGQRVYTSIGYDKPWDGQFDGRDLPTDSYYFIIQLHDELNRVFEGTVTIIR